MQSNENVEMEIGKFLDYMIKKGYELEKERRELKQYLKKEKENLTPEEYTNLSQEKKQEILKKIMK